MKKNSQWIGAIIILVLTITIFITLCYGHSSTHTIWHSAMGSFLIQHGGIPNIAPSYLITQTWYNPTWGADLLWYGFTQIVSEKYAWLWMLIFFLGGMRMLAGGFLTPRWGPAAFLWIVSTYLFWAADIGIFAIFLGIAFYYLLCQLEQQKQQPLWSSIIALLILQVIWINSHASGILGILSFFVWTIFASHKHWWVLVSMLLVSQISPYPIHWWGQHILQFPMVSGVQEYLWWNYWLLVVIYGYEAYHDMTIRRHPRNVLVWLWTAVSFLWPMWAIATAFVIIHSLLPKWELSWPKLARFSKWRWVVILVVILPVIALRFGLMRGVWSHPTSPLITDGQKLDSTGFTQQHPWALAKAYQTCGHIGLVAHDPQLAPYLLHVLPQHRIFWDCYQDYPQHLMKEWSLFRIRPDANADLLQRWNIAILMVDYRLPGTEIWLEWLSHHREWVLIYCDDIGAMFIKSSHPYAQPLLAQAIQDRADGNPTLTDASHWETKDPAILAKIRSQALFARSQVYLALRLPQRSRVDIEQIALVDSKNVQYWLGMGKLARFQGDWGQTIAALQQSWNIQPTSEALAYLMEANLRLGTPEGLEQAKKWSQHIIPTANWFERLLIQTQLAQVLYLSNDKVGCCAILEQILEEHPEQQQALHFLKQTRLELRRGAIQTDLEKGKQYAEQQKYNQALKLFRDILEIDENCHDARIELGKIYLELKEYRQAADAFQKILKVAPDHLLAQTKFIIAIAHLGEWKTAKERLAPLVAMYPDRYEIREALFETDQVALWDLQKRLDLQFRYEDLKTLCEILERHQKFIEAIEVCIHFQDQIPAQFQKESHSRLAQLYYGQGKALLNQRQVASAYEWFEQAIKLDKNFFECHLLMGTLALKRKDWNKASQHFQKIQEIAPLDIRGAQGLALVELGQGLSSQLSGQYEEAISRFEQYQKKAPAGEEKESIQHWIQNLKRVNQELIAQHAQTQSIAMLKVKFEAAAIEMGQQNWERALLLWEEILAADSNLEEARYNRGLCHLKLQHWQEAKQDFEYVIARNPKIADAHLNLGNIYYRLQQYEQTKQHWQAYLDIAPQTKQATIVRQWLELLEHEKK